MASSHVAPLDADVAIIGAGPAGLAAYTALGRSGYRVLMIESGPELEQRNSAVPEHLVKGIGGAGLFSDGKFSFYPSATRLWTIRPEDDLSTAYTSIIRLLRSRGLTVPDTHPPLAAPLDDAQSHFTPKRYLSTYMPIENRYALMRQLESTSADRTLHGLVKLIEEDEAGGYAVHLISSTVERRIRVCSLILATGRFGSLSFDLDLPRAQQVFRRVEVGVRLEQPSEDFFLRSDPYIDSKYLCVDRSGGRAWRTFCCCRDGEVLATRFGQLTTLSGRADCPPSGLSNVGFNVRYTTHTEGMSVWDHVLPRVSVDEPRIAARLTSLLENRSSSSVQQFEELYGPVAFSDIRRGLSELVHEFGYTAFESCVVHGPTLEGVGMYLRVDENLRVPDHAIWSAGDTTGLFRGLTAALVSGYFVGLQAQRYLASPDRQR